MHYCPEQHNCKIVHNLISVGSICPVKLVVDVIAICSAIVVLQWYVNKFIDPVQIEFQINTTTPPTFIYFLNLPPLPPVKKSSSSGNFMFIIAIHITPPFFAGINSGIIRKKLIYWNSESVSTLAKSDYPLTPKIMKKYAPMLWLRKWNWHLICHPLVQRIRVGRTIKKQEEV